MNHAKRSIEIQRPRPERQVMARRAKPVPLPIEVLKGPKIPAVLIRPTGRGDFQLVIEGRLLSFAGTRKQMEAVADWLDLNWFELRDAINIGPEPDWVAMIRRKCEGVRGDAGPDGKGTLGLYEEKR